MFGKTKSVKPLHAQRIEDYGLIGDCETAALVGRNGSIDWLCWPTFSSPACFAALLGTADNGYWKLAPADKVLTTTRRYLPDTMVLETTFETARGILVLVDFMPRPASGARGGNSDIVRIVRAVKGKVAVRMDLAIRFDYGMTVPWVTRTPEGVRAIAGKDLVVLRTDAKLTGEAMSTVSEFTLQAGEEMAFTLTYGSSMGEDGGEVEDPRPIDPREAFGETVAYWREWNAKTRYKGKYAAAVQRSVMTLKAMTFRPSGGIVAAVTAGLPEKIGGPRNWDYRYCWLRDTSFTLLVLLQAGYEEEAQAWRRWLLRAIAGAPNQLQTLYGICGERQVREWEADWLRGYEDSKPVLIGNGAATQFQLDVFGEVATALSKTPMSGDDDLRTLAGSVQTQVIDHLCHVWDQPDDGIWETRGGRKHFVHSKVMAWVALDRAIKHQEQFGGSGDVKRWVRNRAMIHKEVCAKGFNKRLNSFTQSYGSSTLDASCLRIGLVGFLPMDDPRIVGTVKAIEKGLMQDGFVQRYDTKKSPDGLAPGEGAFLACSFWLVTNLWLMGRHAEAETLYERLLALRNDVGLLSEEWDPKAKQMLGNFPQALSHIALAHAAFAMSGVWVPEGSK